MATRKEDVSFSFTSRKPSQQSEEGAEEQPSEERSGGEQEQFRILILGDFSGRTNRSVVNTRDIATRKARNIDTDNLDKVLAAVKPELQLPVDEKTVIPLAFQAMQDFHPDSLLGRIEAFGGMLNLRNRLKDPKTFHEAAAAMRTIAAAPQASPAAVPPASPNAGDDFERLLNQTVAPRNAEAVTADALIANLVAGYSVPEADPEQAKMVQLVEDALSAGLRAVLRHPAFQAIESAWRGAEFLVNRLNTDDELKIAIFDLSKEELRADLANAQGIEKTGLYQVLVEQTRAAGAIPFSLVIGDFEFDRSAEDLALLGGLAELMHLAGVPLVAGASPQVAGVESFGQFPDSGKWQAPADIDQWEKLRSQAHVSRIGLAAPRFLLRMPYGPKTDAIETYRFDEMPGEPVYAGYLWGNGAIAVALVVGEGFLENGWQFEPGHDVEGLPCHMAMVDGDREMTPCAQGWLSDRQADILHQLGLTPLLSVRHAAAVKIAGIHSIAKGGKPLAAAWNG